MADFKEVSLGFAEFVSQLVQETFDAILSSQNYQLERLAEIQTQLDMSIEDFASLFLSDVEKEEIIKSFFSSSIKVGMKPNNALLAIMEEHFESPTSLLNEKKLTEEGYIALRVLALETPVEEKRAVLRALVNGSNLSKLMVDSGEISAKVELNNMYNAEAAEALDEKKEESTKTSASKAKLSGLKGKLNLTGFKRDIKIDEIINSETGKSTILVGKGELQEIANTTSRLPGVRLAVTPTKLNSSSNLFAEVKIHFRNA